jgi:hypothetical protein
VLHLWKDGALLIDAADEIVKECLVTHGGEVVHPRVNASLMQER